MPLATTLIDTREHCYGVLLGYEGPADPQEDGQGLVVTRDAQGWVTLLGPDGEIRLDPREVAELRKALEQRVGVVS
jgi:transglutaminase-like putative cysteine protease